MHCIVFELPTGYGKSKEALENIIRGDKGTLIVIPTVLMIDNWNIEIKKWENELGLYFEKFEFSTYKGLNKMCGRTFDTVIFDECHHITEFNLPFIEQIACDKRILLSATLQRDKRNMINKLTKGHKSMFVKKYLNDATKEGRLPVPEIIRIPMTLDDTKKNITYVFNSKGKKTVKLNSFNDRNRFKLMKDKSIRIEVACTQKEYYDQISESIEYFKNEYMEDDTRPEWKKNVWLNKSMLRLKWLASQKTYIISELMDKFSNKRMVLFLDSIEDTKLYGNEINSKNKRSKDVLADFNEGKINYISTVEMLNEGVNLVNCQIGIWQRLNSSETITVQKIGRILRHKKPILIFPYFADTREEEIVDNITDMFDQ